jgi:hypothetical protein
MYWICIAAGKVVSGYHIHRDSNGVDQWTLLGKRNPLTPQMFYPVETQEPIVRGDKLVRSIYSTLSCNLIVSEVINRQYGLPYKVTFNTKKVNK